MVFGGFWWFVWCFLMGFLAGLFYFFCAAFGVFWEAFWCFVRCFKVGLFLGVQFEWCFLMYFGMLFLSGLKMWLRVF